MFAQTKNLKEMTEKTLWCCDFCGYTNQSPKRTATHEDTCMKNPKNNRPCLGCVHLERTPEAGFRNVFLVCTKKEAHMLTAKHQKRHVSHPRLLDVPMPLECPDFKAAYDEGEVSPELIAKFKDFMKKRNIELWD